MVELSSGTPSVRMSVKTGRGAWKSDEKTPETLTSSPDDRDSEFCTMASTTNSKVSFIELSTSELTRSPKVKVTLSLLTTVAEPAMLLNEPRLLDKEGELATTETTETTSRKSVLSNSTTKEEPDELPSGISTDPKMVTD